MFSLYIDNGKETDDLKLVTINGKDKDNVPLVIDATKYSNFARFINHSCNPDLMVRRKL